MHYLSPYVFTLSLACGLATAGNCLIQGDIKIGDCVNVNVGPSKPLTVSRSGSFSGNYGAVLVKSGALASISGNTDDILVEQNARLSFSGNSKNIRVFGEAEIEGNAHHVIAELGSKVVIKGIITSVMGEGRVIKVKGSIVGREYIR